MSKMRPALDFGWKACILSITLQIVIVFLGVLELSKEERTQNPLFFETAFRTTPASSPQKFGLAFPVPL